jgi:NADPH:quinone reductase-like Zn-dependent oxidoreductase
MKNMRAVRIHRFGPPAVIVIDDIQRPVPGSGDVLVRVAGTGVGPWDALIREGKSKVSPAPPLTLGSDLSGVVETPAPDVADFKTGDEVYGVTNPQFCGANAEFAIASAQMIAKKPKRLSHLEAASAPVIAVTAWQMLFDYARVAENQRVLILGAGGNVGAYAVQFAAMKGLNITAVVGPKDVEYVRSLGAENVFDYRSGSFEEHLSPVDVVLDMVGGETRERSFRLVKPGGIVVSVVSTDPVQERSGVRSVFFYVEVTTARLNTISKMFDDGILRPQVGSVLPLDQARTAHEMLAGTPHNRGKILLQANS